MEIFISYRRGMGDTPFAQLLYFHLHGRGFKVFFDQEEHSIPTGSQFPDAIRQSLFSAKLVVSVVGPAWLESRPRLHDEDDWVRQELLSAAPGSGRTMIPVYYGVDPSALATGLPEALRFLATTNTRLSWKNFDESARDSLDKLIEHHLPGPAVRSSVVVLPRLELLCDRAMEEAQFRQVLRRLGQGRAGWLVFGEAGQGDYAMFERLEAFTLQEEMAAAGCSQALLVQLELAEFGKASVDDLVEHLLAQVASRLKGKAVSDLPALVSLLARRGMLVMAYAVVEVAHAEEARHWHQRFAQLVQRLPYGQGDRPALLVAIALRHGPPPSGWRRWLGGREPAQKHFEAAFPQHFEASAATVAGTAGTDAELVSSRLKPAERQHVESWCRNRNVRQVIDVGMKDVEATFADGDLQHMEAVHVRLAQVVHDSLARRAATHTQENHR